MWWSSRKGPNFRGPCRRRSESRQTRGKVSVWCPEHVISVALAENLHVAACTGVKFENFYPLHRYRCAAIATSFFYILCSQRQHFHRPSTGPGRTRSAMVTVPMVRRHMLECVRPGFGPTARVHQATARPSRNFLCACTFYALGLA